MAAKDSKLKIFGDNPSFRIYTITAGFAMVVLCVIVLFKNKIDPDIASSTISILVPLFVAALFFMYYEGNKYNEKQSKLKSDLKKKNDTIRELKTEQAANEKLMQELTHDRDYKEFGNALAKFPPKWLLRTSAYDSAFSSGRISLIDEIGLQTELSNVAERCRQWNLALSKFYDAVIAVAPAHFTAITDSWEMAENLFTIAKQLLDDMAKLQERLNSS